jgi:hypothetical protein
VLPWPGLSAFLIAVAVVYAGEWAFYGALFALIGAVPDEWERLAFYRFSILLLLAMWGYWRASIINPAANTAYRQWLMTTPWSPGTPLPFGPVHLTWQDAVILALAAALVWIWPLSMLVPLAFLAPYCATLCLVNFRTGQDESLLAVVFATALLPLGIVQFVAWPWMLPLLAAIIVAASLWGWRRALRLYPWEGLPRFGAMALNRERPNSVGSRRFDELWPLVNPAGLDQLKPAITWKETVLLSTALAWAAGIAVFTVQVAEQAVIGPSDPACESAIEAANCIVLLFAWLAAIFRVMTYVVRCAAPISLSGRWATGRLLIPGYDQIFLAPLLTLAVGYVGLPGLTAIGLPLSVATSLAVLALALVTLGMGPTLAE